MVVVSIVLNVPRFFRVTITSPTNTTADVTKRHRYSFEYTPLAQNFVFKVGIYSRLLCYS